MAGLEMGRAAAPVPDNGQVAVATGMRRLEYQPAAAVPDRRKSKLIVFDRPLVRFPPQAFRR
jgi:hypothetical protein